MDREQGEDDDLRADRGGTGDGEGAFCVRIRFADRCEQWRGTAAGAKESGESKRSKTDAQARHGREKSAHQQLTGTLRS
jgi:hypothetical protein